MTAATLTINKFVLSLKAVIVLYFKIKLLVVLSSFKKAPYYWQEKLQAKSAYLMFKNLAKSGVLRITLLESDVLKELSLGDF